MEITKDTRVADILNEYGDIADVMEIFGVQRVGRFSAVKMAARIHRVPLDEFLSILEKAVNSENEDV
jgi:hypothetical protein